MNTPPPPLPGVPPTLVNRAKNMIVTPQTEWDAVDAEPATVQSIYTGYVMILAAIPVIAGTVGMLLFLPRNAVIAGMGVQLSFSTTSIIVGGVLQYVLSLVGVYVMGMIINSLAPNFGSQPDQLKAFKVAAYYPTAAWIAGVLAILPVLAPFAAIAALYSLYVLYLGLPKLMRTPPDKVVAYFVVTLLVAIVVFVAIGYVGQRVVYGGFF